MSKIIDLTQRFTTAMPVHALDEPASIKKVRHLATDYYNDWELSSGMHVGTHIDGPGHLTDSNLLIADMPVDRFVGQGVLLDARTRPIDASLLQGLSIHRDAIVLILTGMDKKFGAKEYFEQYPVMSTEFAKELVRRNIKIVGLDSFSPDQYPFDVHKLLFVHGILIIENLTGLDQLIGVKKFTVVALPLKTATDSALARVIAMIG